MLTYFQQKYLQDHISSPQRLVFEEKQANAPNPEAEKAKTATEIALEAKKKAVADVLADGTQKSRAAAEAEVDKLIPDKNSQLNKDAKAELQKNSQEFAKIDNYISLKTRAKVLQTELGSAASREKIGNFLFFVSMRSDLSSAKLPDAIKADQPMVLAEMDKSMSTLSQSYVDLYQAEKDNILKKIGGGDVKTLQNTMGGLSLLTSLKLQGFPGVTDAAAKDKLSKSVQQQIADISGPITARIAELEKASPEDPSVIQMKKFMTTFSTANSNFDGSRDPSASAEWKAGAEELLSMTLAEGTALGVLSNLTPDWNPFSPSKPVDQWWDSSSATPGAARDLANKAIEQMKIANDKKANRQTGDSTEARIAFNTARQCLEQLLVIQRAAEKNNASKTDVTEMTTAQTGANDYFDKTVKQRPETIQRYVGAKGLALLGEASSKTAIAEKSKLSADYQAATKAWGELRTAYEEALKACNQIQKAGQEKLSGAINDIQTYYKNGCSETQARDKIEGWMNGYFTNDNGLLQVLQSLTYSDAIYFENGGDPNTNLTSSEKVGLAMVTVGSMGLATAPAYALKKGINETKNSLNAFSSSDIAVTYENGKAKVVFTKKKLVNS